MLEGWSRSPEAPNMWVLERLGLHHDVRVVRIHGCVYKLLVLFVGVLRVM